MIEWPAATINFKHGKHGIHILISPGADGLCYSMYLQWGVNSSCLLPVQESEPLLDQSLIGQCFRSSDSFKCYKNPTLPAVFQHHVSIE